VGQAGKFREAAFYKIAGGSNARPNVVLKSREKRRPRLGRPALVYDNRIHASDDDGTHCVSRSSVEFPAYDSIDFAGDLEVLAELTDVSGNVGDS
jgi:hypothetical protein